MRTVCLYILTLSLFLIGGYRFFVGDAQDITPNPIAALHAAKFHQADIIEKQYPSPRLRAALPSPEQKDEIQLEDEDDDTASARRAMLLAKYFVTLVFAAFLFFYYKLFKDLIDTYLERYALSSGKYILQRALRI